MKVDPIRNYEIAGQVYTLRPYWLSPGVGNNQVIVAGVAGFKHRVMGFSLQSQSGSQGFLVFKNGTTAVLAPIVCPGANLPPYDLVIPDAGVFETSTGAAVQCDVGAHPVHVNVWVLTYKG